MVAQTIVFYVLFGVLCVLTVLILRSPDRFPLRPGLIVMMGGALIVVASTWLLPWVVADSPAARARNVEWLKAKPNPWWAARVVIAAREHQVPNPFENFDLQVYLCDTPQRKQWCDLLSGRTSLTAGQLLLRAPVLSWLFTGSLWARLILAVVALAAGLLLQDESRAQDARTFRRALLGVTVVLLLLALFQIPVADTLGLRQQFKADYINLLAGVRSGSGMWWVMAGMAVMAAGLVGEERHWA
jgi:hypothetical protein